jgi:hypothetical protein
MDVKTHWNSILELLERANRLRDFTHKWLKNQKYNHSCALYTTPDYWVIVKYVMEVLKPFRYWTLSMSKRCAVILHHVITIYNDIFDSLDSVMGALTKKKTQWMEDLFFALTFAGQKLPK